MSSDVRDDGAEALPISKSERKRRHAAVQALAGQLAEMAEAEFASLPLEADARDAIAAARGMARGARQRQLRYASQLLARSDTTALRAAVEALGRPRAEAVRAFHAVEAWRDRLLEGDDSAIDDIAAHYPALERRRLEGLVRNARNERAQGHGPKAARQLFRFLRALGEDG